MPSDTPLSTPPSSSFSSREKMLLGLSIGLGLGLLAVIAVMLVQTLRPVVPSGSLVIAPPVRQTDNAPTINDVSNTSTHGDGKGAMDTQAQIVPLDQYWARRHAEQTNSSSTMVTIPVEWQKPRLVSRSALGTSLDGQPMPEQLDGPYLRGTITSGIAAGTKIYSIGMVCDGPCGVSTTTSMVFVRAGSTSTTANSQPYDSTFGELYSEIGKYLELPLMDSSGAPLKYRLSRIAPPKVLHLRNGASLRFDENVSGIFGDFGGYESIPRAELTCWKNDCPALPQATTAVEGWSVFDPTRGQSDLKAVVGEDGSIYQYTSSNLADDSFDQRTARTVVTTSTLAFDAAHANDATYVRYYTQGCGGMDPNDVVAEKDLASSKLVPIGQTKDGLVLYGVGDYAAQALSQAAYDHWYTLGSDGEKPSFQEFLKRYPVPFFIVKGAFGENIRYVLEASVAPMECGKPVIYLYPERTMNVHVALPSTIRVTKSDPSYPAQGWDVVARPDGLLDDHGRTYPYLFWEGQGANYARPTNGFILKDGDVDQRLQDLLSRYGLNAQESQDFRDFWVPHMTGAPYYRVSFVTTEDWNKAVPLQVRPKPVSFIRIFMDWEKLSHAVPLIAPTIVAPTRRGFTLVEWGGLLRK